jgi:hypothetical protein
VRRPAGDTLVLEDLVAAVEGLHLGIIRCASAFTAISSSAAGRARAAAKARVTMRLVA